MKLWLLLLVTLLLSACGQSQNDLNVQANLASRSWILQSYGPASASQNVLLNTSVTLEVDESGNKAGGSGGCNSYGGDLTVRGNSFVLKNIVSTLMACSEPGVAEQETSYFDLLQRVTTFEKTDTTLTLIAGEERLVFLAK